MTTRGVRAFHTGVLAMVVGAVPLLVGQGCPTAQESLAVNAGPDRTIQSGAIVLEATISGGSGVYSYVWSPAAGLSDPNVLQPTFTASAAGTTTYTLTVVDSLGVTASDTVSITVAPPSEPVDDPDDDPDHDPAGEPGGSVVLKANAGQDASTSVGSTLQLSGTASGGTPPYVYAWSPTTGLSNSNVADPVFTPIAHGTVIYTLTVTDALGATATDDVTITVSPATTVTTLNWAADYTAGGYRVLAAFNHPLDPASAATVTNYQTSDGGQPTAAVLSADGLTVLLTFNQKLSTTTRLDVGRGGNLLDADGGTVRSATSQIIEASDGDVIDPSVISRTWGADQNNYTVVVEFSEAMDASSAESVSNYSVAGVRPTRAVLDASGKIVTLTFATTTTGLNKTDLLTISDQVRDINGRANASSAPAPITANTTDTKGPSAPAEARVWWADQAHYRLSVTFDEVLDKASAENLLNYFLNGVQPTAAALDAGGRKVTLTFAQTTGGASLSDALTITQAVQDINGRSNATFTPTAVTANSLDILGPNLMAEQSCVWGNGQTTYQVHLNFSEVLDRASATTAAHYTLAANEGAESVHPDSVLLDDAGRAVTLVFSTTTGGFTRGDQLTVSADVKDINGRATISTSPLTIGSNPDDTTGPSALSRVWAADATSYQVILTFNEVMDRKTATRLANYRMYGNGGLNPRQPTSVVLDSTGQIVTVIFESSGSVADGFNLADSLEIMPAVVDINGRGTTSITAAGAAVADNPADTTPPTADRATFFSNASPPQSYMDIRFSEALDKASAEAATYGLPMGATVVETLLLGDGRTVRLRLDPAGPSLSGDVVTVPSTILDVNGNATAGGDVSIRAPVVVDAGTPIIMLLGQTANLQAVATGGSGNYTYQWTPAVVGLADANTDQPTFTPTVASTYLFTVTVTDDEGRLAADTVKVTVKP